MQSQQVNHWGRVGAVVSMCALAASIGGCALDTDDASFEEVDVAPAELGTFDSQGFVNLRDPFMDTRTIPGSGGLDIDWSVSVNDGVLEGSTWIDLNNRNGDRGFGIVGDIGYDPVTGRTRSTVGVGYRF